MQRKRLWVSRRSTKPFLFIFYTEEPAVKEKLAKVAREMGEDTSTMTDEEAASRAVARVKGLLETLELPTRLADVAVPEEDIPELAGLWQRRRGT